MHKLFLTTVVMLTAGLCPAAVAAATPLKFEPGTKYAYSNLDMAAPRPGKDGPDFWMGFQGALGSQCYFNWYRKRLRLWAIQDSGGTGKDPWNWEWHAGENEFFKYCEKRRAEQRQAN